MPEPAPDRPVPEALSRRGLTALIVGGAVAGGAWSTGLAVLARGWRPRVSVVGARSWQVLLFEHGRCRILVLAGMFEESSEPAIDLLCGVLRQHLDVVAGTGAALDLLSSGFRTRRAVTTLVRFDPDPGTASSRAYVGLFEPIEIRAGAIRMDLSPIWEQAWGRGPHVPGGWIGHASVNGLTVVFGPSLDTMAALGDPHAALAIAPDGDVGRLWRMLPGIAVAANAREPLASLRAPLADHLPSTLVRTFPEDTAMFEFKEKWLTLPGWAEQSDGLPADS